METKKDLIDKIKELMDVDNKIILLKREKDKMEKEKKRMSLELMEVMKKNDINSLNTKNSVFIYKVQKSKPLGKKLLMQLLSNYYKEDAEKGEEVKTYIFDNTPVKITEKITRKITSSIGEEEEE